MTIRRFFVAAVLFAGSSALADGFSATLEMPISSGVFSVAGSLNYTITVMPDLVVGASLFPSYVNVAGGRFGLGARLGLAYVNRLTRSDDFYLDLYLGAGAGLSIVPSVTPVVDAGGGLYANKRFSIGTLYGGLDARLRFEGELQTSAHVYGAFKFPILDPLDVYAEADLGLIPSFGYELRLGMSYRFTPQVRVGAALSYGGRFSGGSGFTFTLNGQFTEKPGTLGTPGPGNYLP